MYDRKRRRETGNVRNKCPSREKGAYKVRMYVAKKEVREEKSIRKTLGYHDQYTMMVGS